MSLLPYLKDGIGGVTVWDANHYFAERGYAAILVDCRGTGSSGGLPRLPFDPAEGEDGAAIVEWVASQPWCDGHVGMWGASYGSVTTLQTASLAPPALKAITLVMGPLDAERDFVHPAGRRGCVSSFGVWGLSTLAHHLTPPLRDDPSGQRRRRWQERLEDSDPYLVDLLRHRPGATEWRARVVDASRVAIPSFCVAGWRDVFCAAAIRAYEQIRGPKKLLVGPWVHTLPDESSDEPVDFLALSLGWWERWLRGRRNGAEQGPAATVYVQRRRTWRRLPDWPPPGGAALRLNASADGRLTDDGTEITGSLRQVADPTVGTYAGLWGIPTRDFAPSSDQHGDDLRSAAFTSEPLTRPLEICGTPTVTVTLTRGNEEPRTLVAKLAHVAGDGRSTLITSGTGATPPGRDDGALTVAIDMVPTAYEIPAGHRVRLTLSDSDFPRLWPEPTLGELAIGCGPATHLALPVTPIEASADADLPTPPRRRSASLVLAADPLYTVTHNAITGAVTVTVGEHVLTRAPGHDLTLDANAHVSASVAAQRPEGASLSGKTTLRATGPGGELFVRAEMLLAADSAVITGEVMIDGEPVFSREWTL